MDKQTIAIIVLSVLLVLAAGYISINKYQQNRQQEQLSIYQQGMQAGYEQAIIQLVQQAVTCQQVPINVQNQTINLIAVECLQTK
ncbi:hypothetical protein COY26_04385 [Candidatus Woesearchaeota archaeon CG_4_10_14_0_2_um_filter_33_10]|nr:MAG: hypothetical protein COY26_04385 [Candidatus Woesearchaeota archaeon CG_4_10_14_0_2_um_filter_33_10]